MAEQLDPINIEANGDLILDIRQQESDFGFLYRVDSRVVQQNSRYFENLLSPRFKEGQNLQAALGALKAAGYATPAEAPADALPKISIVDVGRISKVSTIQNLAADFLRALHDQQIPANPPVANLANLAVVADRFNALPHFTAYMRRKKYLQFVDAKVKGKSNTTLSEERVRQKLLVGFMFDHPPWVARYSKHLILRDSVQWKPGAEQDDTAALWWDLPNGVEDELIRRREGVLETINSLQSHFLKLYSSGERQCKLGYDSSVQCDSFQLGEMIRFFMRIGTVRLQGTIYDPAEPALYTGDIDRLLESLRRVSSYQIDSNHAHCGLRVRILPLIDLIQNQLSLDAGVPDIGICTDCWNNQRPAYAWSLAKRPVSWSPSKLTGSGSSPRNVHGRSPSSCLTRHIEVRDMFMAADHDWTAARGLPGVELNGSSGQARSGSNSRPHSSTPWLRP